MDEENDGDGPPVMLDGVVLATASETRLAAKRAACSDASLSCQIRTVRPAGDFTTTSTLGSTRCGCELNHTYSGGYA